MFRISHSSPLGVLADLPVRTEDLGLIAGIIVGTIALAVVVRWRRRDFVKNTEAFAAAEVCDHLKPALDHILANGGRVTRAGQNHPELPLEIHVEPPFDPQALYAELKLAPPAYVSERNVIYCKEDWCELHPKP